MTVHADVPILLEAQRSSFERVGLLDVADLFPIDNSIRCRLPERASLARLLRPPMVLGGSAGHAGALDWAVSDLAAEYEVIVVLDSDTLLLSPRWIEVVTLLSQGRLVVAQAGKESEFEEGRAGHVSFLAFRREAFEIGDSFRAEAGQDTGYVWQEEVMRRYGSFSVASLRATFRFPDMSQRCDSLNSQAFVDIWVAGERVAHHVGYGTRIFGGDNWKHMSEVEHAANGPLRWLLDRGGREFLIRWVTQGVYST